MQSPVGTDEAFCLNIDSVELEGFVCVTENGGFN